MTIIPFDAYLCTGLDVTTGFPRLLLYKADPRFDWETTIDATQLLNWISTIFLLSARTKGKMEN